MKNILLAFLLYSICLSVSGQKANFAAAERFRSDNLASKYGDLSVDANWIDNSDIFWYSYKTPAGREFWIVNPSAKSKLPLFDRRLMASSLTLITHHPFNELDLPLRQLEFAGKSTARFTFLADSLKFLYDMTTGKLSVTDTLRRQKRVFWASYSPDSTWIVYAKNHNLFMMKAMDRDSAEIQLTTDGKQFCSYAWDERDTSVNRKVPARIRWFKNSKKFYIIRQDETKVSDLFIINSLAQPRPTLESYRYPMPGEKFVAQPELMIFDISSHKRISVDLAKWKDQTIRVGWSSQKSADKLIVIRKDRPLRNLDVCLVNADTGESTVLFSETTWPFFTPDYGQLMVLNEGKDIIWWSERTGWGQLYLYDENGKLKNQITSGSFYTGNVLRIDTTGRMIYFEGFGREPGVHPYYNLKYKASIDRGGMILLTKENADHSFSMSKSGRYFVDNFSRVDMEPVSVLRDNNGNIIMNLEKADLSQLYEAGWKMPEIFSVKAADGVTDLYGVMFKPFDFDSTRKYPVISNVYPGPYYERVPYQFTVDCEKNVALAQLGFVVVVFGHRGGSPLRGSYYNKYGYDNLRDYALADDKYGIEQLAARHSYIDIGRVGIYGRSGGGFMSTAAILTYPDFYKVAVSPAGNHDNNIYNQWWGETYNGLTEVVKKSGDGKTEVEFRSSIDKNQDLAKNLKGHLLLIHGDMDNNVHPANTLRMADALIKANKRFDMVIVPGERHTYGNATNYLDWLMWYYFAEHLLGDYRTNVDVTDFGNSR